MSSNLPKLYPTGNNPLPSRFNNTVTQVADLVPSRCDDVTPGSLWRDMISTRSGPPSGQGHEGHEGGM